MVTVWRPVAVVLSDGDDRIEKAPELFDHIDQPLDVRLRWIALKRCWLDAIDWKRRQQHRRSANRVTIGGQWCASVGPHLVHQRRHGRIGHRSGFFR